MSFQINTHTDAEAAAAAAFNEDLRIRGEVMRAGADD